MLYGNLVSNSDNQYPGYRSARVREFKRQGLLGWLRSFFG